MLRQLVHLLAAGAVALLLALASDPTTLARAQEGVGPQLEQLQVDLWPQYDDSRLLVIYKGELAAAPDRPLRFPIPAGAEVNAVARLQEGDRLVDEAWESQIAGDEQVISFTPGTAGFQLEYYWIWLDVC